MSFKREEIERAALVALSYFIGFITAFIAFGLPNKATEILVFETAPIVTANDRQAVVDPMSPALVEMADGLYFAATGEKRLLAVNQTQLQSATVLEGVYYAIADSALSPDGQFAYYCEQPTSDASACIPYVYVAATDTVHSVQSQTPISITDLAHWNVDGSLTIGEFTSTSALTPWK